MADYVVLTSRLYRTVDGKRVRQLRGDKIGGLTAAEVDRFTRAGAILPAKEAEAKAAAQQAKEHPSEVAPNPGEVSDPGAAATPETHHGDGPPASQILAEKNSGASGVIERPANAATTEAWRTYAVESGQMTEAAAEGLGRNQLREQLQ